MDLLVRKRPEKDQKRVCVVRYGAWGDAVMMSGIFPKLKEDGYHITLNCTEKTFEILHTNPYIDTFIYQTTNEVPKEELVAHWEKLKKQFDKFINLSESIEGTLLRIPSQPEYTWPKAKRHALCNYNYYDRTMEIAGYPKAKGSTSELYFNKQEEKWAKKFLKKHANRFIIVWCVTGSSVHKIYPYAGNCIDAVARGFKDSLIVLVGEKGAKGIVNKHKRILDKCGDLGIRQSFILAKYANLVVSPETSVLVAAGSFETPKVALLSHATVENLTKYYENCTSVFQEVSCYPCHKLHYSKDTCTLDKEFKLPICMSLLHPKKVLEPIEKFYNKWRQLNGHPNTADRDNDNPKGL